MDKRIATDTEGQKPGHEARVDNQGQTELCTSYALGKAITNHFEEDTTQIHKFSQNVIDNVLWPNHNSLQRGMWPEEFNEKEILVTDESFNHGKIVLEINKVRKFSPGSQHVVVVIDRDAKLHTLYVQDWCRATHGDHKGKDVYKCINSHGKQDRKPEIPVDQDGNILYEVYPRWIDLDESDKEKKQVDITVGGNRNGSLDIIMDGCLEEEVIDGKNGEDISQKVSMANENDEESGGEISDSPNHDDGINNVSPKPGGNVSPKALRKKRKYPFQGVDVLGYVDGLTQNNISYDAKTRYFKFDIVSESRSYTVVCFDVSRYHDISEINNSECGCHFRNLQLKKENDYTMVAHTEWDIKDLKFKKCLRRTDISVAVNEATLWSRVHIEGIVYNLHKLPRGTNRKCRRMGILQDLSGPCRYTIFDPHDENIVEDQPYRMTYLRVTTHKGKRVLRNTPETEVTLLAKDAKFPLDRVLSTKNMAIGIQKDTCKIVGFAKEVSKKGCPFCNEEVDSVDTGVVSCQNEHCDADVFAEDEIEFLYYTRIYIRRKSKDERVLMMCDYMLLNQLLEERIPPAGVKTPFETLYRDELISKEVDISFDMEDNEIIKINFSGMKIKRDEIS